MRFRRAVCAIAAMRRKPAPIDSQPGTEYNERTMPPGVLRSTVGVACQVNWHRAGRSRPASSFLPQGGAGPMLRRRISRTVAGSPTRAEALLTRPHRCMPAAPFGLSKRESFIARSRFLATTVLGSFPAYISLSDHIGSRRFDIDPGVWVGLTRALQWTANRYFLDAMFAAGDRFLLTSDPALARPGSWLFHELHHLRSQGASVPVAPSRPTSFWAS